MCGGILSEIGDAYWEAGDGGPGCPSTEAGSVTGGCWVCAIGEQGTDCLSGGGQDGAVQERNDVVWCSGVDDGWNRHIVWAWPGAVPELVDERAVVGDGEHWHGGGVD